MADYSFWDNPLTEDPTDKVARLENVKSLTKDEIIERIVKRGNTLTRTDLLAAINAYEEEIGYITEEGNTVNTPLFNTSLSISGVFKNADDSFDPKRHTIKVNVGAGTFLKEAASKIKLTKVQSTASLPIITSVKDTLSSEGSEAFSVKAGSVIEIAGAKLKFDQTDEEQGIFFVGSDTVRLTKIVEAKPSRVIAVLPPDTAKGEYTVEIRTKTTTNTKTTKKVKRGIFEHTITVIA